MEYVSFHYDCKQVFRLDCLRFDSDLFLEFYEDSFSILSECTSMQISPRMWQLLLLVYETFQRDTIDYFTGMYGFIYSTEQMSKFRFFH